MYEAHLLSLPNDRARRSFICEAMLLQGRVQSDDRFDATLTTMIGRTEAEEHGDA